jgi:hypothetical protein
MLKTTAASESMTFCSVRMTLGTKHRLKEAADLCKQRLRERNPDKPELVEEFVHEFEGTGSERDINRWSQQFADQRQIDDEILERVDAAFEKWLNGG